MAYELYVRRHPADPWLAQPAIEFLDRALPRDGSGLEWGSGRSTKWFGERLARLISVEMSADWFETVRRKIADTPGIDLRYVPIEHPEHEPTRPRYDPLPRYVSIANDVDSGSLDFALVDGHYRQACVLAALAKLRPGGLLAIDNTDWLPDDEWGVPADWQRVHRSSNAVTVTTIWRKPQWSAPG